ncbi:MAG: type II toxin-antitoxin system RelE/ParE family toxin, partial [Planctomycetota bacterium]
MQASVVRIEFHADARRDFDEAFDWYAARSIRAAADFVAEVGAVLQLALEKPQRFALIDRTNRDVLLKRFPYHVGYREHGDAVQVIPIAH